MPALEPSETDGTCVVLSVGGNTEGEYLPTAQSLVTLGTPSAFDRPLPQQAVALSRRNLYRTDSAERYTNSEQPRVPAAPAATPQVREQQLALIDLAPHKTYRARMSRMFSRKKKLEYKELKRAYNDQQLQLFGGRPDTTGSRGR